MKQKIKWNGIDYLLVGGERDGAIATREQYENFDCSTAHLNQDGTISHFGNTVGSIEEIEFLGEELDS